MLYPKCPTCKTELSNKQIPLEEELSNICSMNKTEEEKDKLKMDALDKLYIKKYCCRMRALTYLQQIDIIKYNR